MKVRVPRGASARLAKGAKNVGGAFMGMGGGALIPSHGIIFKFFGWVFLFCVAFFVFSVLLSYV